MAKRSHFDVQAKFRELKVWTSRHFDVGFDLLRAYLGIGLMIRGAVVLAHPELVSAYLGRYTWVLSSVMVHYIIAVHVIGGFLLTIGMVTRLAAAVQIPALFGAIFLVHLREKLFASSEGLELSALVLVMLLVITVFGAGRLSVDHYIFGEAELMPPMPLGRRARRA